jgi:SEC-C motif domain protein
MKAEVVKCPCGSSQELASCCGRYIGGAELAPNAEALMRSRYTAYTLSDEVYLRATWDERTCPNEPIAHNEPTKWLGLDVKKHVAQEKEATVEFVARYKIGGKAHRLHEVSKFVRYDGKWFYVDGRFPDK